MKDPNNREKCRLCQDGELLNGGRACPNCGTGKADTSKQCTCPDWLKTYRAEVGRPVSHTEECKTSHTHRFEADTPTQEKPEAFEDKVDIILDTLIDEVYHDTLKPNNKDYVSPAMEAILAAHNSAVAQAYDQGYAAKAVKADKELAAAVAKAYTEGVAAGERSQPDARAEIVEVLEGIKGQYHERYQKIAAEVMSIRETPYTIFHTLIDEAIAKYKEQVTEEQQQ